MTDELAYVRGIQDDLFGISRSIREGGDEVVPMAFLLVPDGDKFAVHALPIYAHANTKDEAAALIQSQAVLRGARYVIHTNEAWVSGATDAAGQALAVSFLMAGGTLEDLPGRREVLMSNLMGPGVRRMLTCYINEDGTLGETFDADQAEDPFPTRFGNLAPEAP
jgi:hypothetical protein